MCEKSKNYLVKNETARQELLECIKNCNATQTQHQLAVPTHRQKTFISFEDYKTQIINGRFSREIKEETSKHLIGFYNYFLKNQSKIISKELFESEYYKGISLDEISQKYDIPRENITYLRDFYGIKRKGANFMRRVSNEQPLSDESKEIIIGSILGDGHIAPGGYFSEKHSEKQIQYLEWKGSFLTPVLNNNSFRCDTTIDKRSGTKIYNFSIRTITHDFFIEMHKKFYKANELGKFIKIVPDDIGSFLTEKAFAVWFMDDGNTDWPFRNGVRTWRNASCQCKISSESFTYKENEILQKALLDNFGLMVNIRFRSSNKEKAYLRFDCNSSKKMVEMLKKHSTQDLSYKFDEEAYLKHVKKNWDKEMLLKDFKIRHSVKF